MKTIAQIKAFQRKHGLVPDGLIGPQTKRVMAELAKPPSRSARKEPDKSAISGKAPAARAPVSPSPSWSGQIKIADTSRQIDEINFHCTATPDGRWYDRADVNAWHKQRGWQMIGYTYLILLDGTIQEGRPIGMVPSQIKGHNVGKIGIAYVGGLSRDGKTPKDTRTPEQAAAALWLASELKSKFKIKRRVKGHNEYDKGKACPSFNVANDALGAI